MKEFVKNKMSLALKVVLAIALVGTMSATAAFAFTFHGVEIQEQGEGRYEDNELYEILKHFHPDWEKKPADYYAKAMPQVKQKAGFYSVVNSAGANKMSSDNALDDRIVRLAPGTYRIDIDKIGDDDKKIEIKSGLPTITYHNVHYFWDSAGKRQKYYYEVSIDEVKVECFETKSVKKENGVIVNVTFYDRERKAVPIKKGYNFANKGKISEEEGAPRDDLLIIQSGRNFCIGSSLPERDDKDEQLPLYSLAMEVKATIHAYYGDPKGTEKIEVKDGLLLPFKDIDRPSVLRNPAPLDDEGKVIGVSSPKFVSSENDGANWAQTAWNNYQESIQFMNATKIYTYDQGDNYDKAPRYYHNRPLHITNKEGMDLRNVSRLPEGRINGQRTFISREVSYPDARKGELYEGEAEGRNEALGISAVFEGSMSYTWRGANCSTGFMGESKEEGLPTESVDVTDYKDILVGVETKGNSGNQTLTLHPHESAKASVKTYTAGDQLAITKAYQRLLQAAGSSESDVKAALQDLYKSRSFAGAFTGEFDNDNRFYIYPRIVRIGRTGTVQVRHSDGTRVGANYNDFEYFLVSRGGAKCNVGKLVEESDLVKNDNHYTQYESLIKFTVNTPEDAKPDRYRPKMLSTTRPITVEDLEYDYQNHVKPLNTASKLGPHNASYLPRAKSKAENDSTFKSGVKGNVIGVPDEYFNNAPVEISVDNMQYGVNDAKTPLASLDVNNHTLFKVTFNNGSYGIPEDGVEMLSREDFNNYEKKKVPVSSTAYANGMRVCRKADSYEPLFRLRHLGVQTSIEKYKTPTGYDPLYEDPKNNKDLKFMYKDDKYGVCSLSLFDNNGNGVIADSEVVMESDTENAYDDINFSKHFNSSGENLFSARFIYVGDYILDHKPLNDTDESRAFAGSWAVAYEKGVPYEKGWEFSGVINSYEKEHLDVGKDDWKYFDTLPDYNPPKKDPLLVRVDKRLTIGNDKEVDTGISGTWNKVDDSRETSTDVRLDANNSIISKRARGKYVGMKAITVEQPILIGRFDVRTISGSLPDVM